MKLKIGIMAVGFSFLLGGTNSYAEPVDWLAEVIGAVVSETAETVGRTVGDAAGSCIDLLANTISDAIPVSKKPSAKKLVQITEESMRKIDSVSASQDFSGVIRTGDTIWFSKDRLLRYRSKDEIELLDPALEQILFQLEIVTNEQISEAKK